MSDPLVSVVMTNYNYGKYIAEAIRSIARQRYVPVELIVVDDGSQDHSKNIVEELQMEYQKRFRRFSTHYLPANKGINGALNVAMKDVQGEIVVIFDADDVLDEIHLQKLLSVLLEARKTDKTIAFSYCDCLLIEEDGTIIQRGLSKPFNSVLIETESFLPRPSPILASVLQSFFPLQENTPEDPKHSLWKKICKKGYRGVYQPEPLFSYRIHSANSSRIGDKIRTAQKLGLTNKPMHLSDYWPRTIE